MSSKDVNALTVDSTTVNKMITFIELHNFQSHKRTRLNFDKGVNAIIGKSHSGKSVIVKALVWLAFNRPWPLNENDYRSDWGGRTKVIIGLDSGDKVRRVKSDKENYYQINNDKPLVAFKSSVPEPVQALLRLSDINIQQQKDKHFLFSSSPGEVAKILNEAVDLEDIDRSRNFVKAKVKDLSTRKDISEKDLKEFKKDLEEYDGLDDVEAKIKYLEGEEASVNKMIGQITQLEQIRIQARQHKEKVKRCDAILSLLPELESIKKSWGEIATDTSRLIKMEKLLSRYEHTKVKKKMAEKKLEYAEEKFHELMPNQCPLCGVAQ